MSVFFDIHTAFQVRLDEYTQANPIEIAYENTQYEPQHNTPFLRPTLLPGITEIHTFSRDQMHTGVLQIDIFTPANDGAGDLLGLVDGLYDHFVSDISLTSGSTTVLIRSIGRTSANIDGAFFKSSIDINYDCFSV